MEIINDNKNHVHQYNHVKLDMLLLDDKLQRHDILRVQNHVQSVHQHMMDIQNHYDNLHYNRHIQNHHDHNQDQLIHVYQFFL